MGTGPVGPVPLVPTLIVVFQRLLLLLIAFLLLFAFACLLLFIIVFVRWWRNFQVTRFSLLIFILIWPTRVTLRSSPVRHHLGSLLLLLVSCCSGGSLLLFLLSLPATQNTLQMACQVTAKQQKCYKTCT